MAERKHRHIVEIGLTLLAHSHMVASYWLEAFNTSVFLINRLPLKLLSNISPWENLFHKPPIYTYLCTFGCACYPRLRLYTHNKLEFRSIKYVFLDYSVNHKGYRCLDPNTGCVYISRHVVFDEHIFPF